MTNTLLYKKCVAEQKFKMGCFPLRFTKNFNFFSQGYKKATRWKFFKSCRIPSIATDFSANELTLKHSLFVFFYSLYAITMCTLLRRRGGMALWISTYAPCFILPILWLCCKDHAWTYTLSSIFLSLVQASASDLRHTILGSPAKSQWTVQKCTQSTTSDKRQKVLSTKCSY